MTYKIVALVPMRHHSQRVPEKNFRLIAGKPLYAYIIETLLACPEITSIVVDTDSPVITKGLQRDYPSVHVLPRPERLLGDTISMNEVLLYDTEMVPADFYLQTHSTNPMLKPATVSKAIKELVELYPGHDSLFSVTPWQKRLWTGEGKPINHNPEVLLQTQDLPPVYEENSCIYIFTRENLVRRKNRMGEHPLMFAMDASEAYDIDEENDFWVVDALLNRQSNK
ncbi:MAG: acylneuraminate cytidylyltransferase family protein [Anaerolineaceae bacterium]